MEFAFVAPVLIISYFGVAELCGAMLAQRKASHVAAEVGDLVAQCQIISNNDLPSSGNGGFFAVGNDVLYPLSTTNFSMRITSVTANSTDTAFTVGWSRSNGGSLGAYTTTQDVTSLNPNFPTLMPANGSVIMAESRYVYNSPVNVIIKNAMTFNSVFYLSPRQVSVILKSNTANCIN